MLSQLKILDFSNLLPGPYASRMLADLGASVIKVEDPSKIDLLKLQPPQISGISSLYHSLNRNKTIESLDLRNGSDINYILDLIKVNDIIIEGFRPGIMDKMGLGYEVMKSINPGVIYCSLTGYGQTGPMSNKAGHDINYLALSGVISFSGRTDEHPLMSGIQVADIAGGSLHLVIALLTAFIHRTNTGIGQKIDVSMLDCTLSLSEIRVVPFLNGLQGPSPEDHLLNGGSIYDFYRTRDNRWISVGALEPKFFSRLLTTLKINSDQHHNDLFNPKLKSEIKQLISQFTYEEILDLFTEQDACVEPVLSLKEVVESEQIKKRKIITDLQVGEVKITQIAHPIKYSQYNPEYHPLKKVSHPK